MSSVSMYITVGFMGLTPNPVGVGGVYLVQAGAAENTHTWSDWADSSWSELADLKW